MKVVLLPGLSQFTVLPCCKCTSDGCRGDAARICAHVAGDASRLLKKTCGKQCHSYEGRGDGAQCRFASRDNVTDARVSRHHAYPWPKRSISGASPGPFKCTA